MKPGRWPEANVDAKRILRTLNTSESFHFYEAIGTPTGQHASNLMEFLERMKHVKTESLRFHLERKDFKNWIEKTLGDKTLANRIERISTNPETHMRAEIQLTLEKRIGELARPNWTMTVNTEHAVTNREIQA